MDLKAMIEAKKQKDAAAGKNSFGSPKNIAATKGSNVNNSGNKTKMVNRGQRGK